MKPKKILLIQFRRNKTIALHEKKCILRALGIPSFSIEVKNAFLEKPYHLGKIITKVDGVIIGGSGEFSFSEKQQKKELWEKVKKALPFIKTLIKKNIPILGICFGHQILGYLLGSKVISDKYQQETGSFRVLLTKTGKSDPLFFGLPAEFFVQEGHKDSLETLPLKTSLLARGKRCKIQSFRLKNIYGVQFHPELTLKDIKFRLNYYSSYKKGKKNIALQSSPQAKKILRNFFNLC